MSLDWPGNASGLIVYKEVNRRIKIQIFFSLKNEAAGVKSCLLFCSLLIPLACELCSVWSNVATGKYSLFGLDF